MSKTNARSLITTMRQFFAYFGLPGQIVSDNGPPFGSNEFIQFGELNGIKMTRTPPYHPQSNGLAERAVQTVKNVFKKMLLDSPKCTKMDLDELISKLIITYNNTPSTVTSDTPNNLILSYKPRTLLSKLNPKVDIATAHKEKHSIVKPQRKNKHETKTKGSVEDNCAFTVNQKIMYRNVFKDFVKWIPARIVKKISYCTYLINVNNNIKFVHRSQIRKSSLADKYHPNYLTRNVNEEQPCSQENEEPKERGSRYELKCKPLKRLRRSTRNRKAPLRFDFRNYMKR